MGVIGLRAAQHAFLGALGGGASALRGAPRRRRLRGNRHLSNLPLVADHGFAIAGVFAHHALGFYAWCAGGVAVFVGMLGQLALRRR